VNTSIVFLFEGSTLTWGLVVKTFRHHSNSFLAPSDMLMALFSPFLEPDGHLSCSVINSRQWVLPTGTTVLARSSFPSRISSCFVEIVCLSTQLDTSILVFSSFSCARRATIRCESSSNPTKSVTSPSRFFDVLTISPSSSAVSSKIRAAFLHFDPLGNTMRKSSK